MPWRYDKNAALRSWIKPAFIYFIIAVVLLYITYPQFHILRHEVIITLSVFALWRYGWMFVNYVRAFLYSHFYYPSLKRKITKIPHARHYPKNLYFMIPSYKEDFWVSVETFRSILSEVTKIPSNVTIVVATASLKEDAVIQKMFNAHKKDKYIKLIFQHQTQGKRIAMGHALRSIARDYNHHSDDPDSVTIFMDGDSYMEEGFLCKMLPFFALEPKIGALTTNEAAYINSENKWYKDWFNLKFGQRHILFQAHALSRKVMTLTGRLSAYRTAIVVQEDFISKVENDILVSPVHGKFRFLMGDDKTTWFYLLKHGWDMLYLPDVLCISLESRDGRFLELSRTLPYRWFGNTLRNNTRALKLGPKHVGWYIWYAILDQRLIMWTSLVGLSSALILSLFISPYYFLFFLIWAIFVRLFQLFVIALGGHKVSWRFPLLIVYTQWIGALIKIKAFYNLSDQNWSKNGHAQKMDNNRDHIDNPLVVWMPKIMMTGSVTLFVTVLLVSHQVLKIPDIDLFGNIKNLVSTMNSTLYASGLSGIKTSDTIIINLRDKGVSANNMHNADIINGLVKSRINGKKLILVLPEGNIPLYKAIVIDQSDVILQGQSAEKTVLLSYLKSKDEAVIKVQGKRGKRIGYADNDIYHYQSSFLCHTDKHFGKYLLIREANSHAFLAKIGSRKWSEKYPYLRQEIVSVLDYDHDKHKIYVRKPILTEFDAGRSEVIGLDMVENVRLENFSLKQMGPNDDIVKYRFDYTNRFKDVMVDAIAFSYAARCTLDHVRILQSGSHAIVSEYSYALLMDNMYIDGSWNKGKKGNGYVRLARTYYSVLRNSHIKNIRHVTLQWSASGNHLYNLHLGVDINLHGGYAHDNRIDHIFFDVSVAHHWKPIEHCPLNARWAPPDGENDIDYESMRFEKGTKRLK